MQEVKKAKNMSEIMKIPGVTEAIITEIIENITKELMREDNMNNIPAKDNTTHVKVKHKT